MWPLVPAEREPTIGEIWEMICLSQFTDTEFAGQFASLFAEWLVGNVTLFKRYIIARGPSATCLHPH
jgi:hypothetical protein